MGYFKGCKLFQLAYRVHSARNYNVSENTIHNMTMCVTLNNFYWLMVSELLSQIHYNWCSTEVRENLVHFLVNFETYKYWGYCGHRTNERSRNGDVRDRCCHRMQGLWEVIKIYLKGVGRVVKHVINSTLYKISVSRIAHSISFNIHT